MQLTSPKAWENFLPHIDHSRRRYALGLFFILCQCIVWITAAVITQFVYEENDDTSPFLMTCKSCKVWYSYFSSLLLLDLNDVNVHIFLTFPLGQTDIGMALMALFLPIELWNEWLARKSNDNDEESPDDKDHVIRTIDSYDSFDQDLMAATTPYCILSIVCDRTMELTDQTKQIKPWNHKKHMLAGEYNIAVRGKSACSISHHTTHFLSPHYLYSPWLQYN